MVKPYVYMMLSKTDNTFYIGHRRANLHEANMDIGVYYFTSSKIVNPNFSNYYHIILKEFDSAKEAIVYECLLIKNNYNNENCINKAHWINHIVTKEQYNSPERSKKISEKRKKFIKTSGYNPMNFEQSRNKVRESKIGERNPNYKNVDASKHLNVKCSCIYCKDITSPTALQSYHLNGKCSKIYEITEISSGEVYVVSNIKSWCKSNKIVFETCKYSIKVSGKILNKYYIKEIL